MNISRKTRFLTQAGLIAASYAALTYLCSIWGLAYGPVQFRLSEALMVLPLFTPAAIPGLTIGCVLANLGSPYGLMDVIFGSLATLLSSLTVYAVRKVSLTVKGMEIHLLAPLFPVIFNAVLVGIEINLFLPEGLTWAGFAASSLSVGLGELVVCYGLGIPLSLVIQRINLFGNRRKETLSSGQPLPENKNK